MCSVCCTCCKILVILIAVLGALAIILGAVLGFAVLPDIIERDVIKRVRLENGTTQFERWVNTPFPLTFKVYFFNLTNANAVLTGATPIVQERGPYIYKQRRKKQNIVSNTTGDTLSYYQYMTFEFDANASHPLTEQDPIMTLNAPLMGMFQAFELTGSDIFLQNANHQWEAAFPGRSLFDQFTVGDYLFNGINFCENQAVPICGTMGELAEQVKTLHVFENQTISFSFLGYKNNTHDGNYVITAGNDIIEDLGLIRLWNQSDVLPNNIWGGTGNCRNITGRDSTIFPPFIDSDDEFDIFQTDICRVTTLEYVRNEEIQEVTGQRRELKNDTLTNTNANACFCRAMTALPNGDRSCWPDGFLDLFTCMGAPVIMSYPHFMNATPGIIGVSGLNASHDDHVTYTTLEPGTGTPLAAAKRVQFNMVIRPIHLINVTHYLPPAVLPLLWIEEGMELPRHLLDELDEKYLSQLVMVDAVTWTLITVGIVAFIAATLYLVCC